MTISGIYAIYSPSNNRTYIGSSSDIERRWTEHRRQLRGKRHTNVHLQRAFNKYGEKEFIYTILERCNINLLLEREQVWLAKTTNKYNICETVDPKNPIRKSEETKQKISKTRTGMKFSDEHRKNLRESHLRHKTHCPKGHKFTKENLDKHHASKGHKRCRACKNELQRRLNKKRYEKEK